MDLSAVLNDDNASRKRPFQERKPATDSEAKKQLKWSPEEDAKIIQEQMAGMMPVSPMTPAGSRNPRAADSSSEDHARNAGAATQQADLNGVLSGIAAIFGPKPDADAAAQQADLSVPGILSELIAVFKANSSIGVRTYMPKSLEEDESLGQLGLLLRSYFVWAWDIGPNIARYVGKELLDECRLQCESYQGQYDRILEGSATPGPSPILPYSKKPWAKPGAPPVWENGDSSDSGLIESQTTLFCNDAAQNSVNTEKLWYFKQYVITSLTVQLDSLHQVPVKKPRNILVLGPGSSPYANRVAHSNPEASVVHAEWDRQLIFPNSAHNRESKVLGHEAWTTKSYDFIMMENMQGICSQKEWIEWLWQSLTPKGCFEISTFYWTHITCEDRMVEEWAKTCREGAKIRKYRYFESASVREVGFEDIQCRKTSIRFHRMGTANWKLVEDIVRSQRPNFRAAVQDWSDEQLKYVKYALWTNGFTVSYQQISGRKSSECSTAGDV